LMLDARKKACFSGTGGTAIRKRLVREKGRRGPPLFFCWKEKEEVIGRKMESFVPWGKGGGKGSNPPTSPGPRRRKKKKKEYYLNIYLCEREAFFRDRKRRPLTHSRKEKKGGFSFSYHHPPRGGEGKGSSGGGKGKDFTSAREEIEKRKLSLSRVGKRGEQITGRGINTLPSLSPQKKKGKGGYFLFYFCGKRKGRRKSSFRGGKGVIHYILMEKGNFPTSFR